jgi:hypothetical protein
MAKFALLQRQFLPKMYKSVGYLQNYPRTDKKKKEKKKSNTPLKYFFLLNCHWLIATNLKIDTRAFSCKVTHLIIESKWRTINTD